MRMLDVTTMTVPADPKGEYDSTEAFEEAINHPDGLTVYVPPGVYKIGRPLRFLPKIPAGYNRGAGLRLVGEGSHRTFLQYYGPRCGRATLEIDAARSYSFSDEGLLEGFTLEVGAPPTKTRDSNNDNTQTDENAPSDDVATGSLGVPLPGSEFEDVEGVHHGLHIRHAWNWKIRNVRVRLHPGHGILSAIPDRWASQSNCQREGNTIYGSSLHTVLRPRDLVRGLGLTDPVIVTDVRTNEVTVDTTDTATATGVLEIRGNPDGIQSIVSMDQCVIEDNRGWGIYTNLDSGLILDCCLTYVQENGLGGVRVNHAFRFFRGAIASNGHAVPEGYDTAGLMISQDRGQGHIVRVEIVEFDGNEGCNLWVKSGRSIQIIQSRFVSHPYKRALPWEETNTPEERLIPAVGVRLAPRGSEPGAVVALRLDQCFWKTNIVQLSENKAAPYTGITIEGNQCGGVEVIDSHWLDDYLFIQGAHRKMASEVTFKDMIRVTSRGCRSMGKIASAMTVVYNPETTTVLNTTNQQIQWKVNNWAGFWDGGWPHEQLYHINVTIPIENVAVGQVLILTFRNHNGADLRVLSFAGTGTRDTICFGFDAVLGGFETPAGKPELGTILQVWAQLGTGGGQSCTQPVIQPGARLTVAAR